MVYFHQLEGQPAIRCEQFTVKHMLPSYRYVRAHIGVCRFTPGHMRIGLWLMVKPMPKDAVAVGLIITAQRPPRVDVQLEQPQLQHQQRPQPVRVVASCRNRAPRSICCTNIGRYNAASGKGAAGSGDPRGTPAKRRETTKQSGTPKPILGRFNNGRWQAISNCPQQNVFALPFPDLPVVRNGRRQSPRARDRARDSALRASSPWTCDRLSPACRPAGFGWFRSRAPGRADPHRQEAGSPRASASGRRRQPGSIHSG